MVVVGARSLASFLLGADAGRAVAFGEFRHGSGGHVLMLRHRFASHVLLLRHRFTHMLRHIFFAIFFFVEGVGGGGSCVLVASEVGRIAG